MEATETRIRTPSEYIRPVYAVDVTTNNSAIANPADSYLAPTTGIVNFGAGGYDCGNGLVLIPYGVGSSTNTFLLSVFAWDEEKSNAGNNNFWTAWLLASFTCTLCTLTGLAGCDVDNNHLYCGTITLVSGNANVSNEIVSPTGNIKASIILDVKGAKKVAVLLDINGSSTAANCLYRRV